MSINIPPIPSLSLLDPQDNSQCLIIFKLVSKINTGSRQPSDPVSMISIETMLQRGTILMICIAASFGLEQNQKWKEQNKVSYHIERKEAKALIQRAIGNEWFLIIEK